MKINFSGSDEEFLNSSTIVLEKAIIDKEDIKTLQDTIDYIFKNYPKARKSFFEADGSLARGTICLLDEVDAEMYAPEEKEVNSDSNIVFISSLHGG